MSVFVIARLRCTPWLKTVRWQHFCWSGRWFSFRLIVVRRMLDACLCDCSEVVHAVVEDR